MNNSEKYIYKYITTHPEYFKYIEDDFFSGIYKTIFLKIKNHYITYNNLPTVSTTIQLCNNEIENGDISDIKGILDINLTDIDPAWLKNCVRDWIRQRRLFLRLQKASEKYKESENHIGEGDFDKVVNNIAETVNDSRNIDFDFKPGLDFFDPESHRQEKEDKLASPYVYLNNVTGGGYDNKTLNVYLGASNIGKCVAGETIIKIRNEKTKEIVKISIKDFYDIIKEDAELSSVL